MNRAPNRAGGRDVELELRGVGVCVGVKSVPTEPVGVATGQPH
jgi:hypothetical protein